MSIKILCVSDTHDRHPELPPCDILLHAGDGTVHGDRPAIRKLNDWFGRQPARHKIFVPGNHDLAFQTDPLETVEMMTNAQVLIHRSTVVEGIRIFGSPWSPWFHDWAFNYGRAMAKPLWDAIPVDTQILITHGPPAGILDQVENGGNVGCPDLRARVDAIKPRLHVFGHIHEHGGMMSGGRGPDGTGTTFINAAVLDRRYRPRVHGSTGVWFNWEDSDNG